MYPARIFRNCYREAARYGHQKGSLRRIASFARKYLPKETPNFLRRFLSLLIVIGCMPMAFLIAFVTAVWRHVKLRLLLFELRKRDIVTYNQKTAESENLYEAVFVADGWLDRKLITSKFSEKAPPLLSSVKYRRGNIEVWCRSPSIKTFDEQIVEKSSIWKHRRACLPIAHECASSFLQEPLEPHEPPWRISLQHLNDSNYQTLITLKCDPGLKTTVYELLFDRYRHDDTSSTFTNTRYFTETVTEVIIDMTGVLRQFICRQFVLAKMWNFFAVFANLCKFAFSFYAIVLNFAKGAAMWVFGKKPDFFKCDYWKEFILSLDELRSACNIVTEMPSVIPEHFEFPRIFKSESSSTEQNNLTLKELPMSSIPRSNSFTSSEIEQGDFIWTQPLPEDVLWRLCEVSGAKRTALLTSVCVSELKRATFDLAAQRSGRLLLHFQNDSDMFEISSDFRALSDPGHICAEISKAQEKRKDVKMKREVHRALRRIFPSCFFRSKRHLVEGATVKFHSPFENMDIFRRKIILHAELSKKPNTVSFNIHRSKNHTYIICRGIPQFQLRHLVIGIERRIYALASQYGVQTMRLSPFSTPQNSAPSTPLHKCFFSTSSCSIEELSEE